MDNRGEMLQILITFEENNILMEEKPRIVLKIIHTTTRSFSPRQLYCSYQKLCHSKFLTLPHDYPSLKFTALNMCINYNASYQYHLNRVLEYQPLEQDDEDQETQIALAFLKPVIRSLTTLVRASFKSPLYLNAVFLYSPVTVLRFVSTYPQFVCLTLFVSRCARPGGLPLRGSRV